MSSNNVKTYYKYVDTDFPQVYFRIYYILNATTLKRSACDLEKAHLILLCGYKTYTFI